MIAIGDGVVEWVAQRTHSFFAPHSRGIGWLKDGQLVAGVVYTDYNRRNVYVHHAIEGRVTRQYLWTIVDFPFNQLKVDRVTGPIPAVHTKARNFAERFGFKLEATLKDAHPTGDILLYVGRRNDFRWLNENLYKSRLAMAA